MATSCQRATSPASLPLKRNLTRWLVQVLSVEGEGFKMAGSESVVTSSKSETRLRTAVRSPRRKTHSPGPTESSCGGPLDSPGRKPGQNPRGFCSFPRLWYGEPIYGGGARWIRTSSTTPHCEPLAAVPIEQNLQPLSPENGNIRRDARRLSGVFGRKTQKQDLQRLFKCRESPPLAGVSRLG